MPVAIIVLLLVACVGVTSSLIARTRAVHSAADRSAASAAAPTVDTSSPALVSVITDETSGAAPGSEAARTAPQPWISIVSANLSIRLAPFFVAGSGYTRTGTSAADGGSTFVQRADEVSTSSRVVVFIGGSSDRGSSSASVIKAATSAYSQLHSQVPQAKVVVIGPMWDTPTPPADVQQLRTTLKSAARVAGATFVDPISDGWLQAPGRWTPAGVPSAAGQRELGNRMTTVLAQALR